MSALAVSRRFLRQFPLNFGWLALGAGLSCVAGCAGSANEELESQTRAAIVGGAPAAPDGWRNVVKLDNECTGVVIHEEFLITAQHCSPPRRGWFEVPQNPEETPSEVFTITGCDSLPGGGVGTGQDLMVCRFTPKAAALALVPIALGCEMDTVAIGDDAVLVGYGTSSADQTRTGGKQTVQAQVVALGDELEIGDDQAGSCYGDSGGPAFIRIQAAGEEPVWRLAGLLSSGYTGRCGSGFYTILSGLVPWLETRTQRDLSPCFDSDGTWDPSYDCLENGLDADGRSAAQPAERVPTTTCGENTRARIADTNPPQLGSIRIAAAPLRGWHEVSVQPFDAESGIRAVLFELLGADSFAITTERDEVPPYTLLFADSSQVSRVRVSVTDGAGNSSKSERAVQDSADAGAGGCSMARTSSSSAWCVSLLAIAACVLERRRRARVRQRAQRQLAGHSSLKQAMNSAQPSRQ